MCIRDSTYPDHSTRSYTYTSVPVAGQVEPALLTGLTDENGIPYAHWTYDSSALVASSEHAGGVDSHRLSYQKDGNGKITGATHTNPLNAVSQYSFQEILSANLTRSISHALLPGVTERFTYDANGNLGTHTDFNDRLDTYTYDLSRNLETRRVEASGQAEARTVSTRWHPTWRRPMQVAEAQRLTTWIHHGDRVASSAVSYTHLDVYKRQTYGYAKGLPIRFVDPNGTQIVIPLPPPPGWPGTPKPVSYTHLDVYKRQGRHPAGLNFGDCFAYALTSRRGDVLLFKGHDFSQTDVRRAADQP